MVGMACQKVCKQGRDDIIVKVNLLYGYIPVAHGHTLANTNMLSDHSQGFDNLTPTSKRTYHAYAHK